MKIPKHIHNYALIEPSVFRGVVRDTMHNPGMYQGIHLSYLENKRFINYLNHCDEKTLDEILDIYS